MSTRVLLAVFLVAACGGADGTDRPGGGGGGGELEATRFFLPTPGTMHNIGNPATEIDAAGTQHLLYPAYGGGGVYYGQCGAGCKDDGDVRAVEIATSETVTNAMLALGPDGQPRILLSTFSQIFYATCRGDCTRRDAWNLSRLAKHDGNFEVSGEAFAIAPDGTPAFLMHIWRAKIYGQKPPATYYVSCPEGDCADSERWKAAKIADQIWQESSLRFDAQGHPRLATVAQLATSGAPVEVGAYAACDTGCAGDGAVWKVASLMPAYSDRWIAEVQPAVSMELTAAGAPRVLLLAKDDAGKRTLAYLECDGDCGDAGAWQSRALVSSDDLGDGLDLALTRNGAPRIVYTAGFDIGFARCDGDCAERDDAWKPGTIEDSAEMPVDEVIPYWNCTVATWFLRSPSLALGSDGLPRVAYRAEDVSGGLPPQQDPNHPACDAGADMTLGRVARVTEM